MPGYQSIFTAAGPADRIDYSFWSKPLSERAKAFAELRQLPHPALFRMPGFPPIDYYAIVKYADIVEVSRRPEDFSSENATTVVRLPDELHAYHDSLINKDNPEHVRLRRIVGRAFGHAQSPKFEALATEVSRRIVDNLIDRGPGDFIRPVAAEMPIAVLANLMSIPAEDHDFIFDRSNIIAGVADPDFVPRPELGGEMILRAMRELAEYVVRIGEERAANPGDDVVSKLVGVQKDGQRLNYQELAAFFITLIVAGTETTRNSISRALVLLTEHPEQRKLLLSDFDTYGTGAVEEIIRISTPLNWMARTATRDCEMNGTKFRKGDRLFLFYWSANHDEEVFTDPDTFDITRNPNQHASFGTTGPHFCLGAQLARIELLAILRELYTRLPDIRADGEPRRLVSSLVEGYKRLSCTF